MYQFWLYYFRKSLLEGFFYYRVDYLMVSLKLAYFTFLSTDWQMMHDFQTTNACDLSRKTLLREVRNTQLG